MLVTFGVSTVITVHIMKFPSNTLKNTLIKQTYNISHGLLKQSCNTMENTLINQITSVMIGSVIPFTGGLPCGNQSIDLL